MPGIPLRVFCNPTICGRKRTNTTCFSSLFVKTNKRVSNESSMRAGKHRQNDKRTKEGAATPKPCPKPSNAFPLGKVFKRIFDPFDMEEKYERWRLRISLPFQRKNILITRKTFSNIQLSNNQSTNSFKVCKA